MALGITGATSGITSNQATLTGTVSGAAAGQPVGLEFYNADDDSLINTAATQAVVSGTLHLAIKDGEAMFFHDSIDFSALVGRLIMFTDAAGKRAWAYGGSVGGGEALGADLIAGWDLTSGWSTSGTTIDDANTFTTTSSPGQVYNTYPLTYGRIYKGTIESTFTGGYLRFGTQSALNAFGEIDTGAYYTPASSQLVIFTNNSTGKVTDIDLAMLQPLDDVPATGIRLVSTSGGEIRNFAMVETGFNVNTVVSVRSWSNSTIGAGSAGMDWVGLSAGTGYTWYVKAYDGTSTVTSSDVSFTSNSLSSVDALSPATGSTIPETTTVALSAEYHDADAAVGSLSFYDASDDSLIGTASGLEDGETGTVNWTGRTPGGTYVYYVIPHDGTEAGIPSADTTFTIKLLSGVVAASKSFMAGHNLSSMVAADVSHGVGLRISNRVKTP